ncbi:DUF5018 domain-containing protein [Parapedobacter deserti]|uniref:DUF5018 domain-containing protein n=1 Tax=Parapedobacter deserti TaxID=1912957 RepID=A0ABV7JDD9_9SPHI
MKTFNIISLAFLTLLVGMVMVSCQKLEYRERNEANEISDVYATIEGRGRDRLFVGRVVEDTIFLDIDYFYPIDSDNEMDLSRMLLRVTVPSDATVTPSLDGFWDLTAERTLTVTSGSGAVNTYVVKARKVGNTEVSRALLTYDDETGQRQELQAIIQGDVINFSIVPGTVLSNTVFTYTINRHSSGSIEDGESIDLAGPVPFVVSSVGNVQRNYTIRTIEATKLPKGIRPGSAKILFEKRLKGDLGISVDNMTGGIAAIGDFVVLNTRDQNSVYINAFTGERVGEIDLGPIRGSLRNFYSTGDAGGNILVSNLTPNDGNVFNIWKLSSVTAAPEPFIQWDAGGTSFGRKFSIQGSVDGDAIITAPVVGVESSSFARWSVVGGSLVSQTPEIVTISGYSWSNNNADVIHTSATNLESDYYVIGYSDNRLARVSGTSNAVAATLDRLNANFIANAVDFTEFNNGKFVAYNHVNSFTWGSADQVFLIDTEAGFSGDPSANTAPGLIWAPEKGRYGPAAASGAVNGNGTGDVAMRVSENGFYLYLYFMFTNGYVVGVQFDCVDI